MPALTAKDRSDLDAVLKPASIGLALSFVQRPEDMAEAKKITRGRAAVMAKIEKPQAVDAARDFIDVTDALMVARGDLGVEMPLERVPGMQKQITRAARRAGKPVVVATQMLESMITSPVPTRAEVSDVATAVFEGADAVMLSAEFGRRAISGRGRRHDGQDRQEVERDPNYPPSSTPSATSRKRPAPTPSRPPRARSPRPSTLPRSSAGPRPARPRCGSRASGRAAHRCVLAQPVDRPAVAVVWGVHCVVTEDARIRTTWWSGPAASPFTKVLPRPASASSLLRVFHSAPRARPIWCASLSSERRRRDVGAGEPGGGKFFMKQPHAQ